MGTRPFLVGGTDRVDTIRMQATEGRGVAQIGAEGVHSVGVPERGIGFAVKVDDGAQRAQFPAVLRILQLYDVLPAVLPPRLEEFSRKPLRNTRGEIVGEIRLSA
jgi:L-asparaginase II